MKLKYDNISIQQAKFLTGIKSISLKVDGSYFDYENGNLFSSRGINRNNRFNHIIQALKNAGITKAKIEIYFGDINKSKVFDVTKKDNWNYCRAYIISSDIDFVENEYLTKKIYFDNVIDGWEYVLKNNCEGLIILTENEKYKVKYLKEEKLEILQHIKGKEKGRFLLEDNNKVSGTSINFVNQFNSIKNNNNKAIAEVEYQFKTDEGKIFQPRLRRIIEIKEKEK